MGLVLCNVDAASLAPVRTRAAQVRAWEIVVSLPGCFRNMNSHLTRAALAATVLFSACRGPEAPGFAADGSFGAGPAGVRRGSTVASSTSRRTRASRTKRSSSTPRRSMPPAGTVTTDAAGNYSLLLPPGNYNPRIGGDTPHYNRGTIRPVGSAYLADYFINGDNCVMFYGTVRSATTDCPDRGRDRHVPGEDADIRERRILSTRSRLPDGDLAFRNRHDVHDRQQPRLRHAIRIR